MIPRDIKSLLEYLRSQGILNGLTNNLIAQWGPAGRRMLSPDFLPPRIVQNNQDTIEKVRFRTVAAVDGERHSPAQMVDSGELWAKIHYRFGNSDLARQITGPDYEGIIHYLNSGLGMQAAGRILGIFDTYLLQGLVEHDEIANWEAIVKNSVTRRGDNGYFEYEGGVDFTGRTVAAGGDWTDPTYDPWAGDIIPRINFLVSKGYAREGIRVVSSYHALQALAANPFTLRRSFNGPTNFLGQTLEEAAGLSTETDVDRVFRKLKVQAPINNDLRVQTKTGELRVYPDDAMTFIASTGLSEEIVYNTDNPATVPLIVQNVIGFSGIGKANAQTSPGRRSAVREFSNQKDARVELEAWQSTGPVITEPSAITSIIDIIVS